MKSCGTRPVSKGWIWCSDSHLSIPCYYHPIICIGSEPQIIRCSIISDISLTISPCIKTYTCRTCSRGGDIDKGSSIRFKYPYRITSRYISPSRITTFNMELCSRICFSDSYISRCINPDTFNCVSNNSYLTIRWRI